MSFKNEKGITLISLVITIIVLLILAAVSINMIVGDEGLFIKAKDASDKTKSSQEEEIEKLETVPNYIDEQVAGSGSSNDDENISDERKTLAQLVTAANYGDTIEYSAGNVSDWKVFYNSGTNVYIIASGYLDVSLLPNSTDDTTLLNMCTMGTYAAYWQTSTLRSTGASDITEAVKDKFMLSWWNDNKTKTAYNVRATADLLKTTAWSKFATGISGAEAIGNPTLEMWVASWNDKGELYGTDKYTKLYTSYQSSGYYLGTTESATDNYVSLSDDEGYSDLLYFPNTSWVGSAGGYWLASPDFSDNYNLYLIACGGDVGASIAVMNDSGFYNSAVRPVVCLPSETYADYESGNWSNLTLE